MASPDFSEYIDLTVNDLQPADIYNAARDYALVSLPEFNPRVGTVEDALLEAMSYVSGLVTGAINRLPDGLMEGILRLMGFYRDEATFATGNVIFTAIDDSGLTIPVGTQVSYTETTAEGVFTHIFETTAAVVIAEGNTESDPVQISALEAGEKPVLTDGTALTILTPVSRLFEATFDGTMTQGADAESDAQFFSRAATYLGSLSRSLATADQVTNYVLTNYSDAFRVQTYDLTRFQEFPLDRITYVPSASMVHASVVPEDNLGDLFIDEFGYSGESRTTTSLIDSSTPFGDVETVYGTIRIKGTSVPDYDGIWPTVGVDTVTAGASTVYYVPYDYDTGTATDNITSPTQTPIIEFLDQVSLAAEEIVGCVTVFVSGITGASVSITDKAALADDIRSRCIAGLKVYVSDVILAPLSLNIDIKVLSGYSSLEVRDAVDTAITEYLSPSQYPFTTIVRKNALISIVSQIEGVDYVDDITIVSDNTEVAVVNGAGDAQFQFKGTLPLATVTVASV